MRFLAALGPSGSCLAGAMPPSWSRRFSTHLWTALSLSPSSLETSVMGLPVDMA